MKKSVKILGLPVISITEGRELGTSKSLLIDAENGMVAALTIEDEDWYRGVKLIPYESIVAIGEDAITITHSDNILNLDESGDYERLLGENVRVIGTKAISKNGRIQGKITEVCVGDDGRIEQCEITAQNGSVTTVTDEQVSIFGKEVTVVDIDEEAEKKNSLTEAPAFEPAFEPVVEEIKPVVEEPKPVVEEIKPVVEEPKPVVEEPKPVVEEPQPVVEEPKPVVEEPKPVVEEPKPAVKPAAKKKLTEEEEKIASMTQQAEDLKAALQKARASKRKAAESAPAPAPEPQPQLSQKKQVEKAVDERRRRVLLGKHAVKTIIAESGTIIVEAGEEVTEDVLQRARLANKFIELSMNVQ